MGVNKRQSEVTREDVEKATKIEIYLYFTELAGFAPVTNNKATRESVGCDIIEFLESKGERFFYGKDTRWLAEELGCTAYEPCRRTLVFQLRKKLGFTYSSHLSAIARHVGEDVSMIQ